MHLRKEIVMSPERTCAACGQRIPEGFPAYAAWVTAEVAAVECCSTLCLRSEVRRIRRSLADTEIIRTTP